MLDIGKKILTLEAVEVMELEQIIIDKDRDSAYRFLKKNIYQKLICSQRKRCGCSGPASAFSKDKSK